MKLRRTLEYPLANLKRLFEEITVDNIIWWINVTPQWAGFSILSHDNSVLFWMIHFALLFYMDFMSNFIYRLLLAEDVNGFVKANTNISIITFTVNIGAWFFKKRSLIISTIDKVKEIDNLSSKTDFLIKIHKQLVKRIKILVLGYYAVNLVNIYLMWLPSRMDLSSSYYTSDPCPGLDVNKEINKHICRAVVFAQDTTISVVVINYQSLLLFFIAHTAGMYDLMSHEMLAFNERVEDGRAEVKERLSLLIQRYALILDMGRRLRLLYNSQLGIDFTANAYFICLVFMLPLDEWLNFVPLLSYCLVVFFLYCFLCQKLTDAAKVFERSVYGCGWEKFCVSDKKTVYIILLLAQKPVSILAWGMIPIDMKTFADAMIFMYKFITALKY